MALLIDGYNLLHVTALVGRAGSGLQGSREALLRFLTATLNDAERAQTTVVFDAADAPPGLPRVVTHEGMTIRYSSEYPDADALIEELIAANNVPRSLVVVSSDHRLQRAARRRRARFVDSDEWFAEKGRERARARRPTPKAAKPSATLTPDEIDYWLAEFKSAPQELEKQGEARHNSSQRSDAGEDLNNPFPPGYGEDLESE
jgi:predicted RNA-binding protein with PIN domain